MLKVSLSRYYKKTSYSLQDIKDNNAKKNTLNPANPCNEIIACCQGKHNVLKILPHEKIIKLCDVTTSPDKTTFLFNPQI